MKTPSILLLALLAMAAGATAQEPDRAPFINKQIKELTAKVASDLASGALTQSDADELNRAIQHVKATEDSEPTLMPKTRRDMREDLAKIEYDLVHKEAAVKASGSPGASPTP